MRKKDRHRLITRLLADKNIQKQEDFVAYLQEKGVEVTQATISRDIKEMKLIKVPSTEGGYRYSVPVQTQEDTAVKLEKLLKDAFISVDQMDKQVILRTIPGNAAAVSNLIEKQYKEIVFAAINDDDSILIIARTEKNAEYLKAEFFQYI
ncbi:ArgR family transcriptional regulator [Enterococcus sp. DIV0242_7C1]|uniref:Arginine repressor n=1 Tax=Candidatus Enterococcus dunnyi TaxID=1834192 RepID=A0A200J7L9_9ENTE|nr:MULTISPECIES: ArgR family transcriptional regulator [unclassified Enterococcus]MBO0470768.1 ArgR family transcriptional regulator [Enterococcus sp. DIV0242_7C1]MCA5012438.1 ArgR family transcriptional regulator [Enterococcus sp. S23]MCA5015689.1 ArgR family transcriptional regulator [Enterococcus sp. S22(2020)]OUZ33216.1 arginine repressor [Enterococcus sp. 9D6_DIV0238]